MNIKDLIGNIWTKYKTVIIVIVLAIIAFIFIKKYIDAIAQRNDLKNILTSQQDSIKLFKDQNGQLHSQISVVQGERDNITYVYKGTLDSLSKQLKVKDNQIQEYISIVKNTSGQFKTKIDTVYKKDTVKQEGGFVFGEDTTYRVLYWDKWMTFEGDYKAGDDQFIGKYSLTDSLTFTTFYKKTGFLGLGKKDWIMDVSSSNPSTKIENIHNFRIIEERPKRFGVGPSLIVSYFNNKVQVIPGIGVTYSFIRF